MKTKTETDARLGELVEPVLEELGYDLVRLRIMGGKAPKLQIMAERPDGRMMVEDCAKISKNLSRMFEAHDPLEGDYVLEVSSPGLDRPLTRLQDFEKWCDYEARLELDRPVEGRRRFLGVLKGIRHKEGEETDILLLLPEKKEILAFPFSRLSTAKLVLTQALLDKRKVEVSS